MSFDSGTKPVTALRAGELVWVGGVGYEKVKRVTPRTDGWVVVATAKRISAVPEWVLVRWIGEAEADEARVS